MLCPRSGAWLLAPSPARPRANAARHGMVVASAKSGEPWDQTGRPEGGSRTIQNPTLVRFPSGPVSRAHPPPPRGGGGRPSYKDAISLRQWHACCYQQVNPPAAQGWACNVLPEFALNTEGPSVFRQKGNHDGNKKHGTGTRDSGKCQQREASTRHQNAATSAHNRV